MKKTFKQVSANGFKFNFLNLPNTNLFKLEIVNLFGSNIERVINKTDNKNVYGLSHLIEHLSFKSTKDYSTEELLRLIKTEGDYNASTDHDRINYWFKTIMSKMDIAISLVSNYAFNDLANVNQEEFETEKKIVYNEAKRYADDDQTMFYFNSASAVCGYHKEDNVIGIPETISTFTLDDAINIKKKFLECGKHVFNVIYDGEVASEEEIINKILNQVNRFLPEQKQDLEFVSMYHFMLKFPDVGNYQIQNEADQAMTSIIMDVVKNVITTRIGNRYLGELSPTSLDDIIREKNGLTYGTMLYDNNISYKPYMTFACDVSKGTEEKMLELFHQSIVESIDNYNETIHNKMMDTIMLRDALRRINQETYEFLFSLAVWNPEVLDEQFNNNVDIGIENMYKQHGSFEVVKEYLMNVKEAVMNKKYSIVTNY